MTAIEDIVRLMALSTAAMSPKYKFGLFAAVGMLAGSDAMYAARPARTMENVGASDLPRVSIQAV